MSSPAHCHRRRDRRIDLLVPLLAYIVFLACACASPTGSTAAEEAEARVDTLLIDTWLRLGPMQAPLPAFHEAEEKGFSVTDLLADSSLDPRRLWPHVDDTLAPAMAPRQSWQAVTAPAGALDLAQVASTDTTTPAECYLAVFLQTDRWLTANLTLQTAQPVKAYLDGMAITFSDEQTATTPHQKGDLTLAQGKHVLLLHTARDAGADLTWQLETRVTLAADLPAEALTVTTDPTRAVTILDILDAPRVDAVDISADGKLAAISLSEYGPGEQRDRWLEIRRTRDGGLERTWRGDLGVRQLSWGPQGSRLAYTTNEEDKSTIWIHDLQSGATTALVRDIEHLGDYQWGPDGSFLIYSFTSEAEPDERKIKRVQHPADRQPWWRHRSYLVQATVPDGVRRRLTAGPLSTSGWSLSPDGQHLLFFRSEPDLSTRPYATSELWQLDLASLATELILTDRWISAATYGPDPGVIALQGSPSAFAGLGLNLPEGVQPNDYGGQLYLYDLQSGQPRAVSREFAPDIASIRWSGADDRIYAICTDTQYRNLYAYDPEHDRWTKIETGFDVTSDFDLAHDARLAVAYGTSVSTPNQVTTLDLRRGSHRLLCAPAADAYRDVTFGKVVPWSCTLPSGENLDGRIYYPRNHDSERKYPVIVYYYGGTSPVTRDFGGRYPKNVWAGQDYFVYVPEPSGATGYGQAFAARHVNDWGKLTAAEVIAGTKAFLAAHPTADAERVGCIGASYGGFLTMYLVTQTSLYQAAVSHAGISSISSYWGEGFWGYSYGARALAHSFPWSDRDLFVGQSPLFLADRITTPLLLLHGASDTNVPVGESISLFTALKLLGREVELVEIQDQDHWILDHDQRIVWNDTILAFFARWLKDRPAWWASLYPDPRRGQEPAADPQPGREGRR